MRRRRINVSHEVPVRYFLFRGDARIFAVTADSNGGNLPTKHGPWTALKPLDLERGQAQPGLDVDMCLDDLDRYGIHVTDAHVRITEQAVD